jgi:hypothetical protein
VTNKDVAKAAQHQEELHRESVNEHIKQDEKIAKLKDKVEKEALEHNVKEMEAKMNLSKGTEAKVDHAADHETHLHSAGQAEGANHHHIALL